MLISVGFICWSAPLVNCRESWSCMVVQWSGRWWCCTEALWPSLHRRPKMSLRPGQCHLSLLSFLHSFFQKAYMVLSYLPSSSLPPSLLPPLCLSRPFTLPQCPEERGGAFQKPGDHSPLWASGPQSDRGIRIRIDVHSPQCPSDELEGAKTEGAGGRREMKRGSEGRGVGGWDPAHNPRSHWSPPFPLFLHRCRQLRFQVCSTHSGAHTHHTCACTRKYTHRGPGTAHVHARIRESLHTDTSCHTKLAWRDRVVSSCEHTAEQREVTCGCEYETQIS